MWLVVFSVLLIGFAESILENDILEKNEVKVEHFVYWPNGTIPFYIHPEHFDHEQSSIILTALTTFAYKTCLKFLPALVAPTNGQHVLVIENPNGVRQCVISTTGHARDEPHYLILGYECLKSPQIDMMLMKAIGFGFEHNRAIRDLYIRVQKENIIPSAIDLFVMDDKLPTELRALPYDVNSVMHFGERDYSKNGHRTILFLDHKVKQCREGLSDTDLRKIDIVYGPECRKRDRLEKIDLCQGYPGVARKKRSVGDDDIVKEIKDAEPNEKKSLRVNPDITPPPELLNTTEKQGKDLNHVMEELGLKDAVEEITNLVYKLGARALSNVRLKHCNVTSSTVVEAKNATETESGRRSEEKKPDIMGVVEMVAEYIQDMVDHALTNLTAFCEVENDLKAYQRQRCDWSFDNRCPVSYKSTNIGRPMYSTKHRPYIPQSTKHSGSNQRIILYHQGRRVDGGGLSDNPGDIETRRKRELGPDDGSQKKIEVQRRFEGRRYNVSNQSDGAKWDHSEVSMEHAPKIRRDGLKGPKNKKVSAKGHRIKFRNSKATGPLPKVVELSAKNREFYGERMWPDGFVRYVVTEDEKYDLSDLRRRLAAVNRILKARTCVSLEEITEEDAERFEDYLVLDGSADYITGKVGGRQNFGSLELFEGGQHKQHAAMMVMAMLGFYFELARHDRDKHVRVHLRHVRPDKLHHFEKIRSDATLPLPYDYESATHPAWQFWRQIGKTGISTVATYKEKDPDGTIMRSLGQHDHLLSETDIVKINSVYGIKCFDKKPERNNDNDDVDHGSVVVEVDLDKRDEDKREEDNIEEEESQEESIEKNPHALKTWNRHKLKNNKERHRDRDNEERHRDNEEERHRDNEEERQRDVDNEEERHRDTDNHGRGRDRNKHGSRNEEFDDGSREHHRERDRHSNRPEKDRTIREHIEERDKRINKDREHGKRIVRDEYTEGRDKRDKHRKRPHETDEDREEQERVQGRPGHIEKGRGRHKEYESDRERHRERSSEGGRHGRDQNRGAGGRFHEREGKRQHNNGMDMDYKDHETEREGNDAYYRHKDTDNAQPAISDENNHGREETPENNPDYGHGEPIGYQEEMRRKGKHIKRRRRP